MVKLKAGIRELAGLVAGVVVILLILWTAGAMVGIVAAGFCSVACSR